MTTTVCKMIHRICTKICSYMQDDNRSIKDDNRSMNDDNRSSKDDNHSIKDDTTDM